MAEFDFEQVFGKSFNEMSEEQRWTALMGTQYMMRDGMTGINKRLDTMNGNVTAANNKANEACATANQSKNIVFKVVLPIIMAIVIGLITLFFSGHLQ